MNRRSVFLLSIFSLSMILVSCDSNKTPDQVSEQFWLGIKTKNITLVKKYSLIDSMDAKEDLKQVSNISEVNFGTIVIDANESEIETSVTTLLNEERVDIKLTTFLEKHNDVWKVDFQKTLGQLEAEQNLAEMLNGFEKIKEEMTAQLEESVEEIKEKVVPEINKKADDIQEKVIPEIKSELEKAEKEMMESLPELKEIFDELLHEIEKSIEKMLPDEEKEEIKTQET